MILHSVHGRLNRALCLAENLCAILAGGAAVAAMLLVSVDAIMRYAFASPLTFQLYLTENYLLVMLFVMAMSWGFRTGGFIRIDGPLRRLPPVLCQIVMRVGLAASALYMGYLTRQGFYKFLDVFASGEADLGVIDWPVWLSWVWIPIGCGLLTLRLALDAIDPKSLALITDHPGEMDSVV
ncbi:TRAP transporter small permease [Thalassovita taeanensis]|uniref:TRAP transporter small permease protein n=1 Tax=Thalassovita taeanensis TaxID=657014 RepID=A0A1H9BWV1_9RHOB|nr:TRAP transporter small permease [Thalassovita taeanensis]SEP93277.1 TRAP-type C4-dicarboxylate transport system, small permease component [Thalassovita taeanensis]